MRRHTGLLTIAITCLSFAAAFSTAGLAEAADHGHGRSTCPQCRQTDYGRPDLFANYYAQPYCGAAGAQIYPAPLSTIPQHVGHTYYTYQPLMPHELMYAHKRTYHRYYDGGRGMSRTSVHWYNSPGSVVGARLMHTLRIPR